MTKAIRPSGSEVSSGHRPARGAPAAPPLRTGPPLDPRHFLRLRTRLAVDHCKWDPQVGDRSALCPQPLLMDGRTWEQLARWSEMLAAEITAAETELAHRPEVHRELGVPRALRATLKDGARRGFSPCAARVMRFDFHLATEGWRVSEVNSDVPGGFTEASTFTRMMAEGCPAQRMAGDPLAAWTRAMLAAVGGAGSVALLSAPGYLEDQQVTAALGRALARHGIVTHTIHRPEQIAWRSGRATLAARREPVGAVVRFYQAEWICRLSRDAWEPLFVGGATPVSNHGLAALSESKRLPLLWDRLRTPMPVCRALFPPAADPRAVRWDADDCWVVKGVFSNTGDHVLTRDGASPARWRRLRWDARLRPTRWVLQRRFEPVPVASEMGPLFPCVGVYVIDGAAAGAYARVATEPVVTHRAMDAALLIVEGT